ncbi:hypothetical protein [Pseudomonas sp. F(2018)]|uniref:hypothetical protein n=1 Tax=Pseudomonas TaxID=286 RepID=UPI0010F794DC|nr:hypothetical protein [Pseudomonas sp. F(2018)]
MSNFLKRNALPAGVAMLSLLGAMYAPVSLADEGHDEHAQHAAEAPKPASDNASSTPQGKPAPTQKMDHGAMDHGSMNHEEMDHEKMTDGHGGEAEAGSNHDH